MKKVMKHITWFKEKKCGESGYDPTQKYCLSWDVELSTFDMNIYNERACLNVTIDETTLAISSYTVVIHVSRTSLEQLKIDNTMVSCIQTGDSSIHILLITNSLKEIYLSLLRDQQK